MDESQFVWDHFKFNAEQRLKSFNFFVVLSIFANGGIFTAVEKSLAPLGVSLLGTFVVLLSSIFWLVDARSQNLLRLTIPALKNIECHFSEDAQLFRIDSETQGRFVRYTFAFRALMVCQMLFGFGVIVYGAVEYFC